MTGCNLAESSQEGYGSKGCFAAAADDDDDDDESIIATADVKFLLTRRL
jgi:hypothetical protein